ncbi:MAG: dimethyladenosine transferase [Herbinix sp.]|jgi:hypothetical protein|nr:dimethyladenosine transferase [Herbinix sp.]
MEKIVIFGTGSGAEKVMINFDENRYQKVAYVDNNREMQNKLLNGVKVIAPEDLYKINYDKIIICSTAYKDIYHQLTQTYHVNANKIVNNLHFIKNLLIEYYKNELERDEIVEVIRYLEKHDLEVFNYEFSRKYDNYEVDVQFDCDVNMFYVLHNGKRMYFKESFKNKEKVINYYKFLIKEQDIASPHRYVTPEMQVEEGDIVIDAGVAEGNFALDIIDKVSKIYLVEMDREWIKALKNTFKEYGDKVIIVEKFLTDFNDENNITIDELIGFENIDFIKMDIEGEEIKGLKGAVELLKRSKSLKMDICAYHNINDEQKIIDFFKQIPYEITTSRGYMFFINKETHKNKEQRLVRGLVRAIKRYEI